jgi:endoplasmic reticulum-Golgi intermediate compartment protein 3
MKSFDFYPKTLEDFKIQTSSGAIISITSLFIISILFLSEFYFFLRYERHDALFVDVGKEKKIEVYVNMTFPSIGCSGNPLIIYKKALSLDVVDIAGELQIGVQKTIYKRRLDIKTGLPLDQYKLEVHADPKTEAEKNKILAKIKAKDYCGPCLNFF